MTNIKALLSYKVIIKNMKNYFKKNYVYNTHDYSNLISINK